MKDVDFENLKSLVDYMYKGEANVPQHMLQSFIRTAESLQIRGLAEGATKSFDSDAGSPSLPHGLPPVPHPAFLPPGMASSTPLPFKPEHHSRKSFAGSNGAGGILAARLAKLNSEAGGGPPPGLFDFNPDLLPRAPSGAGVKRSRKDKEPHKENSRKVKSSPKGSNVPAPLAQIFNNNYNDEEGALKIDEDSDAGKENLRTSPGKATDDDIVDLEPGSNGVDSDMEEEPSMPGPNQVSSALAASMRSKISRKIQDVETFFQCCIIFRWPYQPLDGRGHVTSNQRRTR